jgi:hypothetical protein
MRLLQPHDFLALLEKRARMDATVVLVHPAARDVPQWRRERTHCSDAARAHPMPTALGAAITATVVTGDPRTAHQGSWTRTR